MWSRAPKRAELTGCTLLLRGRDQLFPLLQSRSIEERAAGGDSREQRGLELSQQLGVTPLEEADPHTTATHCSPWEGCKDREAVESTGLMSHQCPSDAGRKGCELGSQQTVGGRKEGGRKGGRGGLGGLVLC